MVLVVKKEKEEEKKICLPMQEAFKMRVLSLGWEDSLEEDTATHSCPENPMDRGAWQVTVHRSHSESLK